MLRVVASDTTSSPDTRRAELAAGIATIVLVVAHAVVFYPSEIVTATGGHVYGFLPGLALAAGGWLLAALLSYALGRSAGRPFLRRLLGRRFD